ncbi:MAG: polysaccharide biosynthesis tyrosine autokinase [Longimicrobiales bacterium]
MAGGQTDAVRLLAAVYRKKWIVLAALLVGLGAGLGASRFVVSEYQVQGSVWIQAATRDGSDQGPIRPAELLQAQSWVELFKSYTVLDHVVTDLKLYLSTRLPADQLLLSSFRLNERYRSGSYRLDINADGQGYLLSTVEGVPVQLGNRGSAIGDSVGFNWTLPEAAWTPGRVIEFSVVEPREVSAALKERLVTSLPENGRFLKLILPGSNPEEITNTINGLMNRFVDVAASLKKDRLEELTNILDQQRQIAEEQLKRAEMALQGFRVQTITMPSAQGTPVAPGIQETRDPVYENFFQMKITLEDFKSERAGLEVFMRQVDAGDFGVDVLSSMPAANNSVIASLLRNLVDQKADLLARQQKYTDEAEQVKPLLASVANLERVVIPKAVRDYQAQLLARERELDMRINSASTELKAIPPRLIEEARLDRGVAIAHVLHSNLRTRYEEARLAALSSVPDVSIMDVARVPSTPLQDKKPLVIVGFAAASVGLALIGILLFDRRDHRVRYPHQITSGLGLPILGAVPGVKGGLTGRDPHSAQQLEEAFRELRLSVEYAHGAAGPIIFSVSSPETGDGKSTVAGSLAGVFAGQGHRVALIDGDIRRGNLHRSFGVRRAPGLTDYLADRARLEEVLQATGNGGVTLIGSGTRMQAGPELLGSPAMGDLIRTLRSDFTVIIVDTPPLGAGVDAYVLGATTGNMILVVRAGRTDGELAEAKLTLLDRLPVRLLGAVLNDVPPSRLYRQYSYLSGYQAEDEQASTTSMELTAAANGTEESAG